ncbi:metallophosphoesterase [Candidatus Woesearchaeota archaeon]|nr:metallophosphoesterase [Candidatus Woesearchaeota archaeon]MCF7901229.1 metallophosphoesterase [Candidatus Woesearchaeota archaeon]MCF8013758.1 metallophosphoesterase [Candidatus Woesearchaeota archaeon]
MEIISGINIIGPSLFFEKEKILVIGDVHIGQENSIHKMGFNIPLNQFKLINEFLENVVEELKPKTIIINGDLKHDFGKITNDEWDKITLFLKNLKKYSKVIIIGGNHDKILEPIIDKLDLQMSSYHKIVLENDFVYITHGDIIPHDLDYVTSNIIIIGHEHPAIKLKDNNRVEIFKSFLKGKYKDKTLIVMPSLNPISEGTDILSQKLLSPFLKEIKNNKTLGYFEAYILDDKNKVYFFGKLKGLGD